MSNFVGAARWGKTQSIAYTATPGVIPIGVSVGVTMVRLLTTTDAWVTTDGSVPSATNGTYVVMLTPEYVLVTQGQQPKAVQVSAGGLLCTTERN